MEVNKNSIIAISLSAAVLIVYFCVQQFVFNKKKSADIEPTTVAEQQVESGAADAATTTAADTNTTGELKEATDEPVEVLKEEIYTVETNKFKVVFTNKGGDVKSFELKEHTDSKKAKAEKKDTKDCLVQMAENTSDYNRAFSLNLGPNSNPIVNDYFMVKEFPEENGIKKIAFAKNYGTYTLVKQYTFTEDDYMFKLNVIVDGNENFKGLDYASNDSDARISYTLRTSPAIGPYFDKSDRYESRELIVHNGTKAKRVRLSDRQYKKYDKPSTTWLGMGGKYFCELIVPESAGVIQNIYYSTKKENTAVSNSQAYIERKAIGSEDINDAYYIYVGPRSEKELKKFSSAATNGWKFEGYKLKDALHTSTILGWLEIAFKWMLQMINKLVKNWGVSIIIMTILIRLVLFPLTYKSSMGTLKMQEIQPKVQAIQNKYKDNPQKLQEETAKLYQESGYNPMSGCLPMIFQMMALWAMFNLFNNYFEFRGASFIPGWIDDLSVGDSVWSWNKEIPFITGLTGNCIRILPIIYLISQLFYGKITQMGGAAAGQTQANMMIMTYGLPIIFSFMFYNAPSGLLLFWTISNLLQMVQQIIINKVVHKKKAEKGNTSNLKHFSKQGKRR